jgi:hypothetical protein
VVDTSKNVQLLVRLSGKLAAVYHVNQVQHHEGLEQQSVVLHAVGRLSVDSKIGRDQVVTDIEDCGASVQKHNHNDELIKYLSGDGTPHNGADAAVVLPSSVLRELSRVRGFSG